MDKTCEQSASVETVGDLFFLNIEAAYAEALKMNPIIDDQGHSRLQYCYYDGPLTDITLENFIRISTNDFVGEFAKNKLPIPTVIVIGEGAELQKSPLPADIIEEIVKLRESDVVLEARKLQHHLSSLPFELDEAYAELEDVNLGKYHWRDSYYIDPLLALNIAKQKNRVYCGHPTIDGLQICYYMGELPEHNIPNLIHLELADFLDFFTFGLYRLPEYLDMPVELEAELKSVVEADVAYLVSQVKHIRRQLTHQLIGNGKALKPVFVKDRPLRIFIPTSRLTTVVQYSSYYIAQEFKRQGYEVLFYIEENDMMGFNSVDYMARYIDFNPHIIFNINKPNNSFLHDDVINIVWWQDPMPVIVKHEDLNCRANDFNFSVSPVLDEHLEKCAVSNIIRQHFVIDESVFNNNNLPERADKVVFVGSSYGLAVDAQQLEQQKIISKLLEDLTGSRSISYAKIRELAHEFEVNYEFVFWKIWHYVVRDYSVKWLCRTANIPVEIYGRYWDNDPEVKQYYHGELAHGADVANIYKSAKYAVVSHPFEINSQRLVEVAACGCIPVVYDCRDIAEQPHWDDYCLFFKNQEDLRRIFATGATPKLNPKMLAENFTCKHAVDNFVNHSGIKELPGA